MTPNESFKRRLQAGELVIGSLIKTPHPIAIEIMGASGLDFLVLDAEHAPFDRTTIDLAMIAGRAVGCPIIVRVPSDDPGWVLGVLDSGAAGIIVPHVTTAETARRIARAVHYGNDGRGFAGTTRAADYARRTLVEHKRRAADEVCLICMIEDPEGVRNAAEIAAVENVDALFVGRADLSVASGFDDFFAPETADLCEKVLGVSHARTGLYCAPGEDTARWRAAGATFLVMGSEHGFMTAGAAAQVKQLRGG